mgnify:CR=1 FL=1
MKNLLFIFVLGAMILSSCSYDEDIVQNEQVSPITSELKSALLDDQTSSFELISKKELTENEVSNLRSISYKSTYESSTPIYRYLYYSSSNIDHFYTTQNSSGLSHEGKYYSQEAQEFNLMPYNLGYTTNALYRHSSTALKNHMLSTTSSVSSFTSEGVLGYIFKEQQVGTVPLLEYYSSQRNSYLYVCRNVEIENWLPTHDTDFKYFKTLGYVYSGGTLDSKKTATQFIIKNTNTQTYYSTSILLTVKVRESDKYWELTYAVNMPNRGNSVTIPINNTYTVVAADMALTSNIFSSVTNTFTDITNPIFEEDNRYIGGAFYMFLDRNISNYNVTYNFHYDVALGNNVYSTL